MTDHILNNSRDELIKKENKKLILIDTIRNGNNIEINIKDNAGGISKDVISKIFMSHFTTKDELDGTGVGLYMSKKIIENNMSGTIEASNVEFNYENLLFKGAQFKISIPFLNK